MKQRAAYIVTAVIILATVSLALAQDDPGFHEPPPGHTEGEAAFMGGPPDSPPQHGGRQSGPLERWMQHLQKRNPEEFERLKNLHKEDPEAFMQELHERLERLQEKRILSALKQYPNLYEAIMAMPENKRSEVLRKLSQLTGPGQQGPGGMERGRGMGPPPQGEQGRRGEMMRKGMAKNAEMRSLSRESKEIAQAYHQAETPEEKETIRNDLRVKLDELFELREQQRAQQIEQVQGEVDKLRAILEQRRANKDAIIAKRLLELTADETTRW